MESLPIPNEQSLASSISSQAQTGRPSIYTEALADRIVEAIFEGHGLRAISRMPGMPSAMIITRWRHSNPGFRSLYEEARKLQLDLMAEEILDIADNGQNDVPRDRLRTESRKWILSKLVRHVYGTTVQLEPQLQEVSDIDYSRLTEGELDTLIALLEKATPDKIDTE